MSPKKRRPENKPLPSRWTWKGGSIYYIVPPGDEHLWDGKKWFRLGKSLKEAHKAYADRIDDPAIDVFTMEDLFYRFEFDYLPTKARATENYYLDALALLRPIFCNQPNPVDAIKPKHAYKMMDHIKKHHSAKRANQCFECLSSALTQAVRWGSIDRNPMIGTVRKFSLGSASKPVKDKDILGFCQVLPRKWQLYIMFKLHTKGRRKGEILRVMTDDLTDDGIRFVNNKNPDDIFTVGWTPELRLIVKEILESHPPRIGNRPLFFGRRYRPYINAEGKANGFDAIWGRYMRKAVSLGLCERFREHDLRGKAVEHLPLEVASAKLRHSSTSITSKHYRPGGEKI